MDPFESASAVSYPELVRVARHCCRVATQSMFLAPIYHTEGL